MQNTEIKENYNWQEDVGGLCFAFPEFVVWDFKDPMHSHLLSDCLSYILTLLSKKKLQMEDLTLEEDGGFEPAILF